MRSSKSKIIAGAALGAAVGAAMMAGRSREQQKSSFEKIVDQLADLLHP